MMLVRPIDTDSELLEATCLLNPRRRLANYGEAVACIEGIVDERMANKCLSPEFAFRLLHHFLFIDRLGVAKRLAEYCLLFSRSDFIVEINDLLAGDPVAPADRIRAIYRLKSVHYDTQIWPGATVLPELLAALPLDRLESVLDLGCGTGRAGAMLRHSGFQGRLIGVDLSPHMLIAARDKGDYTEVFEANVLDWLADHEARYDLVVVFWITYYFDLNQARSLIALVERVLAPGGTFLVDANLIEATVPKPGDPFFSNAQFESELRHAGFLFRNRDSEGNRYYVCTRRGRRRVE